MRILTFLFVTLFATQIIAGCSATIMPKPATLSERGLSSSAKFDYYMLAMDWMPQRCKGRSGSGECKEIQGFTLHGLWPQFEKLHGTTDYPEQCSGVELPAKIQQDFAELYPSQKLMIHEWEKHGTCSGLSPEAYLALARSIFESVQVPENYSAAGKEKTVSSENFKLEFSSVNSDMTTDSIAVNCADAGRYLQTVYICLDKINLKPQTCPEPVVKRLANVCRNKEFKVAVRPL